MAQLTSGTIMTTGVGSKVIQIHILQSSTFEKEADVEEVFDTSGNVHQVLVRNPRTTIQCSALLDSVNTAASSFSVGDDLVFGSGGSAETFRIVETSLEHSNDKVQMWNITGTKEVSATY